MASAYLSIGTNLGDKQVNIDKSMYYISTQIGEVILQSSIYITKPWGYHSCNDFFNVIVLVETELDPFDLLNETQKIEKMMGRNEKSASGYADRIIDIDIIFYDDLILQTERLTIPHPLIQKREFVLNPLMEIAPNFIHPVSGKSINEIKKGIDFFTT